MLDSRRVERAALPPSADESGYVETDPNGRYGRFDDLLGKGAMKSVYRAFDEQRGMEVAWNQVKLCDVLRTPETLERMYSEVHLLSSLDHDSIIRFHASWIDANNRTFNFITEMFTSGTLRGYRQRYRRVDIGAIKGWARQILNGLVYLHHHDPPVIHRDLKCDNIFVNGHLGQVKIGDLGLAAVLCGSKNAHSVIGTPEFMAPELYEEEYNELVDIYSFGMCILEMLTAEYPYSECSNPAQIYKKVTSGKLPEAFNRVTDPEARRFIGRCVANVSTRSSAEELLLDPFLTSDDHHRTKPVLSSTSAIPHETKICERSLQPTDVHFVKRTDMKITGKMNPEDDTIFLKVLITDKDGRVRNVYFPFDTVSDTPINVANEMVRELEIIDREPLEIAEVIAREISYLVPDWKEGLTHAEMEDQQHHVYSYDEDEDEADEGFKHPFYYLSSPSSSHVSEFCPGSSHGDHYHHAGGQLGDWLQDNMFPDDDDDKSSMNSGMYSAMNFQSSEEHEGNDPRVPHEAQPTVRAQKLTRFCPEECIENDPRLADNFQMQCSVAGRGGGKKLTKDRRMTRNRSLVEVRSQLLPRTLMGELNRRLFKTVGAVENIGFQRLCDRGCEEGTTTTSRADRRKRGQTWGLGRFF